MSHRVIRLDIAYDGSEFYGYARQPGLRTVQNEIESVLSQILEGEFRTSVAGRTDAGVHALGQVVSVCTRTDKTIEQLAMSFQKMLPADIIVLHVTEAPNDFDARHAAKSRRYRYRLSTCELPDPTKRHNVWWTGSLSITRLATAAESFLGTHDFRAFCKTRNRNASTVRDVMDVACYQPGGKLLEDEVWIEIEANAFCHQMVRRIVGRCVEIARGRLEVLPPEEIDVLGCKPAPPHGLYLLGVTY